VQALPPWDPRASPFDSSYIVSQSLPLSRLVAHQRSNQPQEFLLFWPIINGKKKSSDLNISGLTA
jgi:hypothetical protein